MAFLVALLGAVLLVGCSTSGGSEEPQLTSTAVKEEVQKLNQTLEQINQEVLSDPAISKLLEIVGLPVGDAYASSFLEPKALLRLSAWDFRPLVTVESEVYELPRGGYRYNPDGTSEPIGAPPEPWDLEYVWFEGEDQLDLLVDWDAGKDTIYARIDYENLQVELPQQAKGELKVNGDTAGQGEFNAMWYACGDEYIDEAKQVDAWAEVGKTSKVRLEAAYDLSQGEKGVEQHAVNLALSAEGKEAQASLRLGLVTTGVATRENCSLVDFKEDRVKFDLAFEAQDGGERKGLAINAEFWNFKEDSYGGLDSVEVQGTFKVNGKVAAVFAGVLDDLDGPSCPGAHVNLRFADGTKTLREWLIEEGLCTEESMAY